MDFRAELANICESHKVCQRNSTLEIQNVTARLPDLQICQVSTNPTRPSFFFFSTEVHNFSVKRNKNPTEISLVKNHLHTEYTEVTSFSCFSFIIRPTHDYTKIFFIDLKRIVQSNYWIYKECFDSPGFHPSSANEASIKLV